MKRIKPIIAALAWFSCATFIWLLVSCYKEGLLEEASLMDWIFVATTISILASLPLVVHSKTGSRFILLAAAWAIFVELTASGLQQMIEKTVYPWHGWLMLILGIASLLTATFVICRDAIRELTGSKVSPTKPV